MLEMLSPTAGDMLRFAATVVKVRNELNRAMKDSPAKAQARAVEIFCAPPEAARRPPTIERLKDDTQRFFGWKAAQWAAFEAPVQALLASAIRTQVLHDGLKVQCYQWLPTSANGKPRKPAGRMLLCHGWEGYGLNFALLISKALQAGYEVHTFDHLAHGDSEGTQSGLPTVLETLLTIAKHVTQQHGAIDVLVGHSLGGAAAGWAAAHRAIKIQRLVLLAPFYDTHTLSTMWAKAHLLTNEIRAQLEKGLENSSGKTFDDFMPKSLAPHFNEQPKLPVLILHDKADKITAYKHSAEMAQLGHHITLTPAPKLGHIAILADETSTQAVMDFVVAR
jgi:alpha-beta hydrolase superfamily lysophospholipase